jgi:hypothetical protein
VSDRLVDDAKALILERGTIRSSAIAEMLDCTPANVHELLRPCVESGELIACGVEVGGEKLIDYRHSVAGKGRLAGHNFHSDPVAKRPPTPVRESAPTPAPIEQPKEAKKMTNTDKIVAALKEHGPATTRQLRERGVKTSNLGGHCAQLVGYKTLVRLGGGARSSIWGLPGQKLSDHNPEGGGVDMDARTPRKAEKKKPAAAGRGKGKARKGTKARRKRAAVLARVEAKLAREAREAAARQPAADMFRPAITHDGAITLTGAVKPGELNRAEARVLTEFLVRMRDAGVRA